ncbi:MAG: Membrane alanine aminopeptidase, partial [Caulobacter sp.]|nr:Membrane alanine aminopeptidase [Caulobacter sp.]
MTPSRYRLHLTPDAAAGTFSGELTLGLAVEAGTEAIVLDCLDLDIEAAWIDAAPVAWRLDGDRLMLTPTTPLGGRASVRIAYAGRLSDTARGLYRGEGFIASQLQPDHARRVFPCLDDPSLRAVLELSVTVPDGWTAISNAAVAGRDGITTTFAPTPPLPTHLMAVALGAFHTTGNGPVSLHTLAPGPNDAWVQDTAVAALAFFADWLGVPYAFGKLDLVLLPEIGVAGMENTGAIFLRRAAVARPTREAATLIAHEIAHQWFGGLVTPAGWDELWLNEGFATWLAPKAVAADLADDGSEVAALRAALNADSSPGARPLSGPVPDDPAELFDVLTYRKGAALLRMLEGWIGDAAMRAGLARYLADHALGVVRSGDLWAALEAASGQPVAAVAGDFVRRAGPARVALRWEGRTVHLAQAGDDLVTLPVALRIATGAGEHRHTVLLEGPTASLTLPGEVQWAVADGYFRILYPDGPPPPAALTPSEAIVLVEDAWLALWAGESDLPAFLDLAAQALTAGPAATVLRPRLADLRDLLAGGARQPLFDAWLAGLDPPGPAAGFADLQARLAEDEDAALAGLCALTDPAVLADQLALLDRWPVRATEGLLANPAVRAPAWDHLKRHWNRLGEAVQGLGGRGLVAGLAAFTDPAAAADIIRFFHDRPAPAGLAGALDRIASRAGFQGWARTAMDAFLLRQGASGPAGDHAPTLAGLVAGFQGALVQRVLLDSLGLAAPPWMHTAENLRGALGAAERAWLQSLGGQTPMPADLSRRLVEDLEAAAAQLAALTGKLLDARDRDAAPIVVAGLARAAITAERRAELAALAAAVTLGEA